MCNSNTCVIPKLLFVQLVTGSQHVGASGLKDVLSFPLHPSLEEQRPVYRLPQLKLIHTFGKGRPVYLSCDIFRPMFWHNTFCTNKIYHYLPSKEICWLTHSFWISIHILKSGNILYNNNLLQTHSCIGVLFTWEGILKLSVIPSAPVKQQGMRDKTCLLLTSKQ